MPEPLGSDLEPIRVPSKPDVDPNDFPMEEPEFRSETPRDKLSSKRSSQRLIEEPDSYIKKGSRKGSERQRSKEGVDSESSITNRATHPQSLSNK